MKLLLLSIFAAFYFTATAQDIYLDTKGTISFFSSTPIEDIDAVSNKAVNALNIKTGDVFFKVKMESFTFKKALMQEHFNENYIESHKYPYATFKGTIDPKIDLTREGTYNVNAIGDFTIHGVTKPRTIPGTIVVKDNSITITGTFEVMVADHQIKIPTIVVANIAETVQAKVQTVLTPAPK